MTPQNNEQREAARKERERKKAERAAAEATPTKDIPAAPSREGDPIWDEETGLPFTKEELSELAEPQVSPEQTAANRLMQSVLEKKRQAAIRTVRDRDRGKIFYVECRYCTAPGIVFRSNPGLEPFSPQEWFSNYKKLEEGWIQEKIPFCQACQQRLPLKRAADGVRFAVVRRYLKSLVSADHRGVMSGQEASA